MKIEDVFDYLPARPKLTEEKLLLDSIHENSDWLPFLHHVLGSGLITPSLQNAFHTKWIECGHFIRSQLKDDKAVALLLLKLMPKYSGDGLTVFRGENEQRFNSGKIGFCWTTNREVAKMFARGLNACQSRGLLLQCYAPSGAIFSGPNEHSHYLGESEVTVNPVFLENVQIISYYPRSH